MIPRIADYYAFSRSLALVALVTSSLKNNFTKDINVIEGLLLMFAKCP